MYLHSAIITLLLVGRAISRPTGDELRSRISNDGTTHPSIETTTTATVPSSSQLELPPSLTVPPSQESNKSPQWQDEDIPEEADERIQQNLPTVAKRSTTFSKVSDFFESQRFKRCVSKVVGPAIIMKGLPRHNVRGLLRLASKQRMPGRHRPRREQLVNTKIEQSRLAFSSAAEGVAKTDPKCSQLVKDWLVRLWGREEVVLVTR